MDRPLDNSFVRARLIKRGLLAALATGALVATVLYLPGLVSPAIARSRIRTAVVDRGPVEATIAASGTVLPDFEGVVSSPLDARVLKIFKRTGDVVRAGEPLVALDDSDAALAADKLDQDLALKQNQRDRARLDLEAAMKSYRSQWEIKHLEHQSLESTRDRTRALFDKGVLSEELLRTAERDLATASIQLQQIEDGRRGAEATTRSTVEALDLEIKTLTRARDDARRTLGLATTRADRDGVLTFLLAEEGAAIQKGAIVARIADLRSFRVDASVSDVHIQTLAAGLDALVRAGETDLRGRVTAVLPTVTNGTVTVTIALDDRSSPALKANQRVDVLLVTDRIVDAVRVAKGPFASGDGARNVFVLHGDRAVRTPVRLGVAGRDEIQVLEGLEPGDEVIVSDTTAYSSASEIRIT
jgi:HlyD family secretion protein